MIRAFPLCAADTGCMAFPYVRADTGCMAFPDGRADTGVCPYGWPFLLHEPQAH